MPIDRSTDIIAVPERIAIVDSDGGDWVGLYLNGTLAHEGHSIEPEELLNLLGVPYASHSVTLATGGRLAHTLAELNV